MFSQAQLDRCGRRGEDLAARRFRESPKTEMRGGDGVVVRSIPKEAYLNACSPHGHNVDPHDDGYWKDMERRYPWIKVPYTPRSLTVRVGARLAARGSAAPLTRHGRVTWRKVYT
jgi:hypothetical protein